jgi:hypothetical protein
MAAVGLGGVNEHATDAADAHRLPIEYLRKIVALRAGEHLTTRHQRMPSLMAQSPGGFRLGGVKGSEGWTTEAFGPDGIFRVEDAFEDDSFRVNKDGHDTSAALRMFHA